VAGVGTPSGFHGIPVIMITGNPSIFERMKENAGAILTGEKSLQQAGEEIYQEIITLASGKLFKA